MSSDTAVELPARPVALAPGDELPPFTFGPVTRTDIVRYAGAGGDFNVIHHDEEFAQAAGLPSVFSMGLLQGGVLAQRLARWVGPHNVAQLRLRFTGMVWPGDVIAMSGRVTDVVEQDGERVALCELQAVNSQGEAVLKAEAQVRVAAHRNLND